MSLRRIISKRIRHSGHGIDVVGDINAVIAANTRNRGSSSHVSSKQTSRVAQRGGRTEVFHDESTTEGDTRGEGRED